MADGRDENRRDVRDRNEGRRIRGLQAALLVLSAAMIAHGIWNGSMADVLNKAVRICTECIGLG